MSGSAGLTIATCCGGPQWLYRSLTAHRERRAAHRAIGLGYVVSKLLGADELPYVLQTESGLTLEQIEELLDLLEAGAGRSVS